MDSRVLVKLPIACDVSVDGKYEDFSIPAVQDLHFSHELVHPSGKMECAMERIHEWHSYGQMEASSANYSPVQLIPMVTRMKGRALWSSSCPSLYPSFYMEMFSIFLSFPPRNGEMVSSFDEIIEELCGKTELGHRIWWDDVKTCDSNNIWIEGYFQSF